MSVKTLAITVLLLLCIVAAACAPAGSMTDSKPTQIMAAQTPEMMDVKPTDAMMDVKPTDAMMEPKPTDAMMDPKPTDAMMEPKPTESSMGMPSTGKVQKMDANPAWFKMALTDVRTGENFTVAGFAGKVILLENMAAWCPNCLAQQNQIKAMLQQMGMVDDLVVVGLGVDLNEDAALLKTYADKNGFDWKYAVATPAVAKEISTLYGAQFLNPTPTPLIIIDRSGNVFLQEFGVKSAETLQKIIAPHLAMK